MECEGDGKICIDAQMGTTTEISTKCHNLSLFPLKLLLQMTSHIIFTIDTVVFHRESATPPTVIHMSTNENEDLMEEINVLYSLTCSGTSIESPALEW